MARQRHISKFIYWAPRILSILFIAFLALFSLDVIAPGRSLSEIIAGLLMHNIPVFILTLLLIISWKYEIVGGITFIGAGLFYIGLMISGVMAGNLNWLMALNWSASIAGPAFVVGILFIMNWIKKKRTRKLK